MESVLAIAGLAFISASIRAVTSSVRLSEAASGNWTNTKNAPWSSCGRKPVGVRSEMA